MSARSTTTKNSPSPRPSPSGRGRIVRRPRECPEPVLAQAPSTNREATNCCSLSLGERFRERAGVLAPFLMVLTFGVLQSFADTNIEVQFDAANKLYAQSKFVDAATAYEKMIAGGSISPALYFNLGNARFKSGQMGQAIAAYRQAEEMSPRDPDVRANLQFARNQVPGPKLGAGRWQRWLGSLSVNEWVFMSTAAVWVTFGLLIACQIKPALAAVLRSWIWLGIATSLVVFVCTTLASSQNASHRIGVVAVTDAAVRNGPFDESPAAFTAHDGAELRVLDQKDDWFQVTDGTSRVGWLKRDALVLSPRS
jgi:tetratricopeptide (TPR) repeat protein